MAGVEKQSRPGRGLLIAGIVCMALAVLGVAVAVAVLGSRIEIDELSRDVAINGDLDSPVPGQIGFRIIESLSSSDHAMTVGVAASSSGTEFDCRIVDVRGEPVAVRRGTGSDAFVSADVDSSWTPVVVAEGLLPGEYSAVCDVRGEPSTSSPARFTVGRVFGSDELFGLVGSVIGIVVAVVLGGVVGLAGLIMLIAGLVRRNKAAKGEPPIPPGGPPYQQRELPQQDHWPQQQWPQQGPVRGTPQWPTPPTAPPAPPRPAAPSPAPPQPRHRRMRMRAHRVGRRRRSRWRCRPGTALGDWSWFSSRRAAPDALVDFCPNSSR